MLANTPKRKAMPRQNFISKDFFVNSSETAAKQSLMSIPAFMPNVKFISENIIVPSLKFLYERPGDNMHHHVDVSVLPLTDDYTKITLHVAYINGHSFHNDQYVHNALYNFETAVHAAAKGSTIEYLPKEVKQNAARKLIKMASLMIASIGMFFIWKKFS
jgi:hypothetical protein